MAIPALLAAVSRAPSFWPQDCSKQSGEEIISWAATYLSTKVYFTILNARLLETKASFFEKAPGIFRFFTLSLEIPDKSSLHLYKLHKTVSHITPLRNFKTLNKDPWKFHMTFFYHP